MSLRSGVLPWYAVVTTPTTAAVVFTKMSEMTFTTTSSSTSFSRATVYNLEVRCCEFLYDMFDRFRFGKDIHKAECGLGRQDGYLRLLPVTVSDLDLQTHIRLLAVYTVP